MWRDINGLRSAGFIPYHKINIYFEHTEDMHDIYRSFGGIDIFEESSEKIDHPCVHLIWGELGD